MYAGLINETACGCLDFFDVVELGDVGFQQSLQYLPFIVVRLARVNPVRLL